MKAVLEFNYPEDAEKCRRAVHADKAFDMLWEVLKISEKRYAHKADLEEALRSVYDRISYALQVAGEE